MSLIYAHLAFNQTVFDTPQIVQFIGCTPMLKTLYIACVVFEVGAARINVSDVWLQRARRQNVMQCRIGSLAFCFLAMTCVFV
jgi:hypothetical protein